MKKIFFLIVTLCILSSCSKDDNKPKTELEKLPAATQSGANTVGCLLDGKAFLPGNYTNAKHCFYQIVDSEYYFHVSLNNTIGDDFFGIALNTNEVKIFENQTFDLFENESGNTFGSYTFGTLISETNQTNTGKLTITKLDEINHTVSGTFWFDVLDTYGVVHQIREGRFDMQYTN